MANKTGGINNRTNAIIFLCLVPCILAALGMPSAGIVSILGILAQVVVNYVERKGKGHDTNVNSEVNN